MKLTRKQLNHQLSWIMKYAHKLYREGIKTFSEALKLSWAILRSRLYRKHTKVAGISYHQAAMKSLLKLSNDAYNIRVISEISNRYDPKALAVVADIRLKDKQYKLKLGYLSKGIVALITQTSNEIDSIKIINSCITGQKHAKGMLGLNLTYVIINSAQGCF